MRIVILSFSVIILSLSAYSKDCTYEDVKDSGIGTVVYSILSPEQFKKVNGLEWDLMEGQTLTYPNDLSKDGKITTYLEEQFKNKKYVSKSKLPDAGGMFFRILNTKKSKLDPLNNRKIGDFQNDAFQGHDHSLESWAGQSGHGSKNSNNAGYGSEGPYGQKIKTKGIYTKKEYGKVKFSSETRPVNISVNAYVKVRLKCVKIIKKVNDQGNLIRKMRRQIEMLCKMQGNDCKVTD